mmetsp:Transcript_21926/g.66612  ORF Transcript_21926/g.66612 Transcript_21926/m.66612 type:complete len:107 (-) Transcript_21926:38-358(-)
MFVDSSIRTTSHLLFGAASLRCKRESSFKIIVSVLQIDGLLPVVHSLAQGDARLHTDLDSLSVKGVDRGISFAICKVYSETCCSRLIRPPMTCENFSVGLPPKQMC